MRKGSLIVIMGLAFLLTTISPASQQQRLLSESSQVTSGHNKDGSPELLQYTAGGHVLGFRKGEMFVASGNHALRVEFVNGRPVSPGEEAKSRDAQSSGTEARPLTKVSYGDLWDGVTLFYENHGSGVVKSTYHLEAGAATAVDRVDEIRLRYNVPVKIDAGGGLVFSFATGELRESRPVAWQEIEGKRVPVEVTYRLRGEQEVGFKAGSYDPRYPLVIDPVLSWNTFLGGASNDYSSSIVLDAGGNVYVAGTSDATWGTPVHPFSGGPNAYAAKLNGSGVLLWHTFLGASSWGTNGPAIAVDASGSVYVAYASFLAKLNASGVAQWNAFLGSGTANYCNSVAVDASGNIYVAGYCNATWGTPVNPYSGGGLDAYAAKLNGSGVVQWNTFLGGAGADTVEAFALDPSGNIYLAGTSYVTWGSPVRPISGSWPETDVYVAKLNGSGALQWNTFLGSGLNDYGYGIAVDTSGNVYVAGTSYGTWGSPVRPFSGSSDAFAAKLNGSGALLWNAFLGSSFGDSGFGIAVDTGGYVYMAGVSEATWGTPDPPYIPGPYSYRNPNIFVAKLNSGGTPLLWNGFFGGTIYNTGDAMTMDSSGNVYVAGRSQSTWGTPVRPFAGGTYDAFVAKIGPSESTESTYYVFDGHDFDGNGTSDISIWRPSNGIWFIKDIAYPQWGTAGDFPVNGDYDGNLITDVAVWRPSNGYWFVKNQSTVQWGTSGDIPVPGKYDSDNKTDMAVWRPSDGCWFIKYSAGGVGVVQWGTSGDIPVPGDYDGDGLTDIAVWRPSNGYWFIRYSGGGIGIVQWGASGDIPVPGKYDSDNKTDIAVWRPSNGCWFVQNSAGGVSVNQWGTSGDIPAPGDYDGNGSTDIAVFRPSNGYWFVKGQMIVQWGTSGDVPLVR